MDEEPLLQYLKGELPFEEYQAIINVQNDQEVEDECSNAPTQTLQEDEDVAEKISECEMEVNAVEPAALELHSLSEDQLIVKYLSGEVSFTEFNSELEQRHEAASEVVEESLTLGAEQELENKQDRDWIPSDKDETSSDDDNFSGVRMSKGAKKKGRGRRKDDNERRKRVRKVQTKKSVLTPELSGLMGEANLAYARNRKEEAIKMMLEIIRQAPTASEPYRTLAMIYEEEGDKAKYIQYAMVAAHLGADGPEEWLRLAELALEQGNVSEAISCHSKAIRLKPRCRELYERRAALYQRNGEERRYLDDTRSAALYLPADRGEEAATQVRSVAARFMELNDPGRSADMMQSLLEVRPADCDIEDINYLVEYILCAKKYAGAFKALVQHCNVKLQLATGSDLQGREALDHMSTNEWKEQVQLVILPEDFHIDLQGKLLCSAIHIGLKNAVMDLVTHLRQYDVEEYGDIMLDVAEAYFEVECFDEAHPVLKQLLDSPSYSQAAVWLRYADCLRSLGQPQEAVMAYEKVVELAPTHYTARLSLAAVYQQLGETQAAVHALEDGFNEASAPSALASIKEVRLLIQRCFVFVSLKRMDSLIRACKRLLYAGFWTQQRTEQFRTVIRYSAAMRRMHSLRDVIETRENFRDKTTNPPSSVLDDIWEIFIIIHDHCAPRRMWDDLLEITMLMLLIPKYSEQKEKRQKLEFVAMTTCFLTGDDLTAFELMRSYCLRTPGNVQLWNTLCQLVSGGKHARDERFCLRLLIKNPHNLHLSLFNGHHAMASGSYKHALGEYLHVHRVQGDAFSCLCVAVTFVNIAFGKQASIKHALVLQAMSYLCRYLRLRGPCQEAYYNLGRAMQQCNLTHLAIHYYEKVLSMDSCVEGANSAAFDLKTETAYNLAVMYQRNGSNALAADIANRYIVI